MDDKEPSAAGALQEPAPARSGDATSVVSLVLGIIAVPLALVPFLNVIAIVAGGVAIVLGIVTVRGAKRGRAVGRGRGVAGIALGSVAVGLSLVVGALALILIVVNAPTTSSSSGTIARAASPSPTASPTPMPTASPTPTPPPTPNASAPGTASQALTTEEECRLTGVAPLTVAAKAVEDAGRITIPVWAGNQVMDTSITITPFISGDTLVPGLNAVNDWRQAHPECASPELQDFLVKMFAAINYFRQGGLVNGQPPEAVPTADDAYAMITVSKAGSALAQQMGAAVSFPDFEQWIEDIQNP